jgi:hypothetical protein
VRDIEWINKEQLFVKGRRLAWVALDSAGAYRYTSGMRKPATRQKPSSSEADRPEAAYEEWLAEEIRAGCVELDARDSIPAEKVWQELGLE